MFRNQALERVLLRENARLRRELRRKEQQVSELLDNFVFHKLPDRLVNRSVTSASGTGGRVSAPSSEHMSDAYSALIRELEEEIDNSAEPTYQIDTDDDD